VLEILVALADDGDLENAIDLHSLGRRAGTLACCSARGATALPGAFDEVDVAARKFLDDRARPFPLGTAVVGASRRAQQQNGRRREQGGRKLEDDSREAKRMDHVQLLRLHTTFQRDSATARPLRVAGPLRVDGRGLSLIQQHIVATRERARVVVPTPTPRVLGAQFSSRAHQAHESHDGSHEPPRPRHRDEARSRA